jgi:hypothetical protein
MKTQWHTAEGYVEYAQVFEQNRDMGTNGSNANVDKARKKTDGLYKVAFYPADEENFQKMKSALSDPMFQGHPRWKEGSDLGVGYYTVLTRKHLDPSGVEDFGGAPQVVHWGADNKDQPWIYQDDNGEFVDGALGNATKVLMKYTTYGEGESQTVRMVKIGVIDHVEYVPDDGERF